MESASHKLEILIANVLRFGVILAAATVVAGAALYLSRNGHQRVDYHHFVVERQQLRSVRGVLSDAFSLRPRALMQFGLLLLVATPVTRVMFSVFVFLKQRDWMYTVFTIIVLSVLMYSLLGH